MFISFPCIIDILIVLHYVYDILYCTYFLRYIKSIKHENEQILEVMVACTDTLIDSTTPSEKSYIHAMRTNILQL